MTAAPGAGTDPPYVLHEQALLACALADVATLEESGTVSPADFALPLHAIIWGGITTLYAEGHPVSVASVTAHVGETMGTAAELWETASWYVPRLLVMNPVPIGAAWHADHVRRYALVRRIAEKARALAALAEADDLRALGDARTLGALAAGADCAPDSRTLAAVVTATTDALEAAAEGRVPPAVRTGVPTLDGLGAFRPGDLAILAARPSVGKSLLAFQMALHAAQEGRRPLFVSLEMTGEQLVMRALSAHSKVTPHLLATPALLGDAWGRLLPAAADIAARPGEILDSGEITLETVMTEARRLNAQGGLALVVLDYLQLLPMPNLERVSVADALGSVTRRLKLLAKDLGCVVLALSQLNREGDTNRPELRHLRSSGSLEQDADTVLLMWPNDQKGEDGWRTEMRPGGTARPIRHLMLDVRKNRNGPTRAIPLLFDPSDLTIVEAV